MAFKSVVDICTVRFLFAFATVSLVKTLYRLWSGCDRLIKQKQPRIDVEKPSQSLSLLLGDF
jgi:hypothetical protein